MMTIEYTECGVYELGSGDTLDGEVMLDGPNPVNDIVIRGECRV